MLILAAGNPFIQSYAQSDWLGKCIFLALFFLSAISWSLIIYKGWLIFQVKKLSKDFLISFSEKNPLDLKIPRAKGRLLEVPHPFFELYLALKQKALQIMSRNHLFAPSHETSLSEADLNLIESQVHSSLFKQHKILEKNLFVLSTIATLGPFLGLLGTVWGILLTFSELNAKGMSVNNTAMLSGLSMALATTVIGLVVAIPALVGYNYLKNATREYRKDMQDFSQMLLASVELQYRKPDHAEKVSSIQ